MSGATTKVSGKQFRNSISGDRLFALHLAQCCHHDSRCGDAALHTTRVDECLLNNVKNSRLSHPFNCSCVMTDRLRCGHQATIDRCSIDQYRADATLPCPHSLWWQLVASFHVKYRVTQRRDWLRRDTLVHSPAIRFSWAFSEVTCRGQHMRDVFRQHRSLVKGHAQRVCCGLHQATFSLMCNMVVPPRMQLLKRLTGLISSTQASCLPSAIAVQIPICAFLVPW